MRRKILALSIALIAIAISAAWIWKEKAGAPDNKKEKTEGEVSVLVSTKKVMQQEVARSLTVFGEVNAGKIETIDLPQPGQLIQLPVIQGQRVHQGEVVAVLSTDPSAQAAFTQALNAEKFAIAELSRVEELLALQLATQSQLEASKKSLLDAKSNLAAQKSLGGDLALRKILAPFNGIITAIDANQGDRIAAGTAILHLGRMDYLRIMFGVEQSQIASIHTGMDIDISAIHDPNLVIKAKLSDTQNVIDPKTRQAMALVELPVKNSPSLLAPGTHVQAQIRLGNKSTWQVPRQAVLSDDKGDYLFQVKETKAIRVAVIKTIETAEIYGVEGKLDVNLPIVVLGNYELQDGMTVRESKR